MGNTLFPEDVGEEGVKRILLSDISGQDKELELAGIIRGAWKKADEIAEDKGCNPEDIFNLEFNKGGVKLAIDFLVQNNLGLVYCLAKKYMQRGMESEDLIQTGTVGLIKAARKFNPERSSKFSLYAYFCIKKAIIRGFLYQSKDFKIPSHVGELKYIQLISIRRKLTQELGRDPSYEELAYRSGYDIETVEHVFSLILARFVSLNQESYVGGGLTWEEKIPR